MNSDVGSSLITGSTGTVGSAVVKSILSDNFTGKIRCATRYPENFIISDNRNIEPVIFDYADPKTISASTQGVDAIFLVTGYSSEMLSQSKMVLDFAKKSGVNHIVHLGALSPDDTNLAHLSWHQFVESYIQMKGFSYTHLRPNFFMNPVLKSLSKSGDQLFHFYGDSRVSFAHVDDIAAIASAALTDPANHFGKIYPIASEALTMSEVAKTIGTVWNKDIYSVALPIEKAFPVLTKSGMETQYAAGLVEQMREVASGTAKWTEEVFKTVENLLGRPSIKWRTAAENWRKPQGI